MNLCSFYISRGDYVCTLNGELMVAKKIVKMVLCGDEKSCIDTKCIDAYTGSTEKVSWFVLSIEEDDEIREYTPILHHQWCISSPRIDESLLQPFDWDTLYQVYKSLPRIVVKNKDVYSDSQIQVGHIHNIECVSLEALVERYKEYNIAFILISIFNRRLYPQVQRLLLEYPCYDSMNDRIYISKYSNRIWYIWCTLWKGRYHLCKRYSINRIPIRVVSPVVFGSYDPDQVQVVRSHTLYSHIPTTYSDIWIG